MKHILIKWTLISIVMGSQAAFQICHANEQQPTIFTYRTPESATDLRYNYDTEALKLALEKTKAKYGPYRLVGSPVMNFSRATYEAIHNTLPNFFFKQSYDHQMLSMNLDYVRFPVDRGIVGWRVCFTNKATEEKLKDVRTLDDLKKFTHGQGTGWIDVGILRAAGFKVEEVSNYESLFSMVAADRFDLFCRGANEILDEWNAHKNIKGLIYDKLITIYYVFPRFFFTNVANKASIQRINEGLLLAYKDGSLEEAWWKSYKDSIEFAALQDRKIFTLENPGLTGIDFDYKQYYFDPLAKKSKDKKTEQQ